MLYYKTDAARARTYCCKKEKNGKDKMKKELFFDRYCAQQFAAIVEDGTLMVFSAEEEESGEIVGNFY